MLLQALHPRTSNCADVSERRRIESLLDFLPVLYPGGDVWLRRRLDDVAAGRAVGLTVVIDGTLAGVSFGILKPSNHFKISTLFVAPEFRHRGVGRALLDAMLNRAIGLDTTEVYITGATSVRGELAGLLENVGFSHVATERDRYGAGRDEDVYRLTLAG